MLCLAIGFAFAIAGAAAAGTSFNFAAGNLETGSRIPASSRAIGFATAVFSLTNAEG